MFSVADPAGKGGGSERTLTCPAIFSPSFFSLPTIGGEGPRLDPPKISEH